MFLAVTAVWFARYYASKPVFLGRTIPKILNAEEAFARLAEIEARASSRTARR
jgi:hypothetical protein